MHLGQNTIETTALRAAVTESEVTARKYEPVLRTSNKALHVHLQSFELHNEKQQLQPV